MLKTGHGTSPDWWACGVLMYEMLFGKTPFAPPEQLLQQAVAPHPPATSTQPPEGGIANRRLSFSNRQLVTQTGMGQELDATMWTYKAIMAYANQAEPKLDFPSDSPSPAKAPSLQISQSAKDLLEDLLEPSVDARLGCRSGAIEDIHTHEFFEGFNFVQLEDGSMPAPFADYASKEAAEHFRGAAATSTKANFDAPYVHLHLMFPAMTLHVCNSSYPEAELNPGGQPCCSC